MEKISFAGLLLSMVWISAATTTSATPLGSFTNNVNCYTRSDSYPDTEEGMNYLLGLSDDDLQNRIDDPDGVDDLMGYKMFVPFQSRVTFDDISYTFAINSINYDYWDQMADYILTDGNPMSICGNHGAADVGCQTMEWSFTESYSGQGIDFENYTIDNLFISIDDLQVEWLDYASEYYWCLTSTITVDGHPGQPAPVPEPSTLLLFGAGLANLVGYRLRRKNK